MKTTREYALVIKVTLDYDGEHREEILEDLYFQGKIFAAYVDKYHEGEVEAYEVKPKR